MNSHKSSIIVILIAFICGLAGMATFYNLKLKPSPEQKLQLEINNVIRSEVCQKFRDEIDSYKASPDTFRRGTLKNITNEARETAKIFFPQLPNSFSFTYSDSKKTIFGDCENIAQRWVKIPSNFPDSFETELAELRVDAQSDQISLGNVVSTDKSKKVALVIGNSTYSSRPLKNPVNDADDISSFLRQAGFKVTEIKNAGFIELRSSIKYFDEQLTNNDIGIIYYSGHGIEFQGKNYLIPIDAQIRDEEDIPRQGFDISSQLQKMSKNNKANIFILDACRSSPIFTKHKGSNDGLTQMMAPTGTIIAYSAAPGQLASDGNGRNSPYTAALLKEAKNPNKKIEDVLKETSKRVSNETGGKQVPWYNSSLIGDFYFTKQ
jgi:Caspase domain